MQEAREILLNNQSSYSIFRELVTYKVLAILISWIKDLVRLLAIYVKDK